MDLPASFKALIARHIRPFSRFEASGDVIKGVRTGFLHKTPWGVIRGIDIQDIRRLGRTPYAQLITNAIADQVSALDWEITPKEGKHVSETQIMEAEEWLDDPNENPGENFTYLRKAMLTDAIELDAGVWNKVYTRDSYEDLVTQTVRDIRPTSGFCGFDDTRENAIEFVLRGKLKPPKGRVLSQLYVKDGATYTKNPDIYGVLPDQCAYFQFFWTASGRAIAFNRDEIVYVMKNPKSYMQYGWSYLQASKQIVDSLMAGVQSYQQNFNSDEIPDGFLEALGASKEDTERMKEMIVNRLNVKDDDGIFRRKWNKFVVVNQPVKWTPIKLTPRDLDLLAQQEWFLKVLLMSAGITQAEAGIIDNANKASAFVDSRTFKRKCMVPWARKVEYSINSQIMSEINPDMQFRFLFTDIDDDLERDKLRSSRLKNGVITVNEVREEDGLDPVSWGDEPFKGGNPMQDGIDESLRRFIPSGKSQSDFQEGASTPSPPVTKALNTLTGGPSPDTQPALAIGRAKDIGSTEEALGKFFTGKFIEREKQLIAEVDRQLNNNIIQQIKHEIEIAGPVETKSISDVINNLENFIKGIDQEVLSGLSIAVKNVFNFGVIKAETELQLPFKRNDAALAFVEKMTFENIKDVTEETSNKLRKELKRALINGESSEQIKGRIQDIFQSSAVRAKAIARTELNRAFNAGAMTSYSQSGLKGDVEWLAIIDAKTAPVCRSLNQTRVPLGDTFEFKGESFRSPPAHPNCYDAETEVYTDKGWQLMKDVRVGQSALSLNPETFDLEYIHISDTVERPAEKMLHFVNRGFDLLVTEDHNMFYQKRWDRRTGKNNWQFTKASELPPESIIYRSSNWVGVDFRDVMFDDVIISAPLFCEFMGWYLSEGSTSENRIDIAIHQSQEVNPDKYDRIAELCDEIGFDNTPCSDRILIRNKSLHAYLSKLGKSHQKFVPTTIKASDKDLIRIFLDAYCLGDGSIREGSDWKEIKFRPEREYFTASKRLADDIGELLIKVGRRPSYRLQKNKGKEVAHRNGVYVGNHDIWRIRECYSQTTTLDRLSIKSVRYSGLSYCLTLEKYHTLLVRRNGKVCWSGNCRSTVKFVPTPPRDVEDDGGEMKAIDYWWNYDDAPSVKEQAEILGRSKPTIYNTRERISSKRKMAKPEELV